MCLSVCLFCLSYQLLCCDVVLMFVCLSAPAPNNVQPLTSNHCLDRRHNPAEWFYTRPRGGNCQRIQSLDALFEEHTTMESHRVTADDIVFVFQFPNPRDGHELTMSRLHQTMLSVFTLTIGFDQSYPPNGTYHQLCLSHVTWRQQRHQQ